MQLNRRHFLTFASLLQHIKLFIYETSYEPQICCVFLRSWREYGDVVLDEVKEESKDHVGEMENKRNAAREKDHNNSMRWTTFEDDDENYHPNLFSQQDHHSFPKGQNFTARNDHRAYTNPFSHDYSENNGDKMRTESFQNPFWIPRQQY